MHSDSKEKNTTKSHKKGFGFEYTVSSMFQNQGYLTRRGVPLQYGIGNNDATDIDVLGIMFTGTFQGHIIICDCKNKVKSKPYERIFWAKGLGEFVKASSVYVALNKTQAEIIRFANTGGVKVLTSDIISDYTNNKPTYGLADESFYEQYEKILDREAKTHRFFSGAILQTKKLFLSDNPYLALNIALANLEDISRMLKFDNKNTYEQNMTLKYLACQYSIIVGLQLLWICADVFGLPEKARREHISNKLTFGDLEPDTVKGIINNAKDLANEIIKSSVPKSVAPREVDFGEITPPPYTDSLIGLVERALARPQMYMTIPQILDFMLFEQGLKGIEYSEAEFQSVFGFSLNDEKVKASRNILSFIRDSCEIDWKKVWGKSKEQNQESTLSKPVTLKAIGVIETDTRK
jgi:hypothetical protein